MQHIIEEYADDLKELISKALPHKKNDKSFDAQEAQESILDFLTMMELLIYESKNESEVSEHLQKQLMPSIDHIDRTSCDSDIVDASAETASQQIQANPKANPQELLFKELLKQWKPSKEKTVKH